jgi:aspartyl-tRNA(Asn)/glutamyl-tRNA(Gln) amidotransferase subunit C
MSIDDPERLARELAGLARLELHEGEAARFGEQLQAILGYLDSLQQVDVAGVPEYLSAEQPGSSLRDDVVAPSHPAMVEAALAGVPSLRGRLVAVPKFKED